jgi:hypothetical protein
MNFQTKGLWNGNQNSKLRDINLLMDQKKYHDL